MNIYFYISTGLLITVLNNHVKALESESIIGGEKATPNQFKYQVSLHYNGHMCGGGIISDQHIITAAHCVINDEEKFAETEITIVLGTNDANNKHFTAEVEKLYVPAEFEQRKNADLFYLSPGDIAVLKLEYKLNLTEHNNLCKLNLPSDTSNTYEDEIAMISGFGWQWIDYKFNSAAQKIDHRKGGSDHTLRYAEALILSNKRCQRFTFSTIYESHICAKVRRGNTNTVKGICSGDSGSPLVVDGDVVVGIVSGSGGSCDEKYTGGIYTRVSSYLKFINNAIEDKVTHDMRAATWKWKKVFFGLIWKRYLEQ